MKKLIAAINMTLDGFCDHTAVTASEELHQHYTDLLNNADTIIYGRKTYQLMESYWPSLVKNPTGDKHMDEFAAAMDHISKIVFSHTLNNADPTIAGWKTARLAHRDIKEEVSELRQQEGKDILVGSPSLIVTCMNLNLIDELQLCVHTVIAGKGLPLFKNINGSSILRLLKTKAFRSGPIIHYYEPAKE